MLMLISNNLVVERFDVSENEHSQNTNIMQIGKNQTQQPEHEHYANR